MLSHAPPFFREPTAQDHPVTATFRWQHLIDQADQLWPPHRYRDLGVVVGCSGGADSVALARVLAKSLQSTESRGFLVLAHFNHQLRGLDSERDAAFVRDLAAQLGADFRVGCALDNGETRQASNEGTRVVRDEASLRDQRRSFFLSVLKQTGARYLALGHSQTDQAETILFRLMRGTGAQGLAGIAPFRPFSAAPDHADFVIARPLLGVSRNDIREALVSAGFEWCEDDSNESLEYRRNWIRSELLPRMESQFPNVVKAIARAGANQRQWADAIEPLVDQWLERFVVSWEPLRIRLDRDGDTATAVLTEALRRCWSSKQWPQQAMTQTHWLQSVELVRGTGPSTLNFPGSIRTVRDGEVVLFLDARRDSLPAKE